MSCGQSYEHFTLVNYDSRVVIWVPVKYNSRVVIYDSKMFTRLATGHTDHDPRHTVKVFLAKSVSVLTS